MQQSTRRTTGSQSSISKSVMISPKVTSTANGLKGNRVSQSQLSKSKMNISAVNTSVNTSMDEYNAKRNRILNFLVFLCESEIFLEKLRQKICSCSDFEPYAFFSRIDQTNKREVDAFALKQFMLSIGRDILLQESQAIISFYDKDSSKTLSFPELMGMVLTTEDHSLREKVALRPTFRVKENEFLSLDLELTFGKLVISMIQLLEKVEEFRCEIDRVFDLQEIQDAFDFLNRRESSDIRKEHISQFLQGQGYNPSSLMMRGIVKNFKGPRSDYVEVENDYDEEMNQRQTKSLDDSISVKNRVQFIRFLLPDLKKEVLEHALEIQSYYRKGIPVRKRRPEDARKQWIEIFKQRIGPEKEIEYCKQDLAMQKDFNVKDLFTLINTDRNEYISLKEFVESLEGLGIHAKKDELYLFFIRHAKNRKKGMLEKEFISAILPNQRLYDKVALNAGMKPSQQDSPEVNIKDIILPETQRRFKKLMLALLRFELKMEAISTQLAKHPNFSYEDFFEVLDIHHIGYFSYDNLKIVFQEHHIDITEKDLSFLFERLDCKERDQKIQYIEFMQEVQPKLPKNMPAKIFSSNERNRYVSSMASIFDDIDIISRTDEDQDLSDSDSTHKRGQYNQTLQRKR